MDFQDSVVVITGAARGMGRAYANAFLEQGANLVGLDRTWDDAPLPPSGNTLTLACDVTSPLEVQMAYAQTIERFGTVDVLINNAAMRQRDLYPPHGATTVLDTLDEHWQRMFEVNVIGVLNVIRQFVQPMRRQRRGSIVNVSSNGGITPTGDPGVWTGLHTGQLNQPYDASKAALTNMSLYLADDLKAEGVAVNVVFPAGTRTTGSDEMVAGRQLLGLRGSTLLRPEHVVPLVLHLAAQDASGDTGKAFDAVQWNLQHGHGGPDVWLWDVRKTQEG